jgi:hypothetical protein
VTVSVEITFLSFLRFAFIAFKDSLVPLAALELETSPFCRELERRTDKSVVRAMSLFI